MYTKNKNWKNCKIKSQKKKYKNDEKTSVQIVCNSEVIICKIECWIKYFKTYNIVYKKKTKIKNWEKTKYLQLYVF